MSAARYESLAQLRRLRNPLRSYFKNIFGIEPNIALEPHRNALSIMTDFLVDPGLSRDIDMSVTDSLGEVRRLQARGVSMWNRTGFIDGVLRQITDERGEYNGKPFSIIMLDVNGVKQMDNASKAGADYALNQYASAIQHVVEKHRKTLVGMDTGRFGGDENVIFVPAVASQADAEDINVQVLQALQATKVPYKNNTDAPIEFRPINSKAKVITLPKDEINKTIFFAYLKRGQIIEEKEIVKIRHSFGNETDKLNAYIQSLSQRVSIYPKGIDTIEQKMKYVCDQHAEIRALCELATEQDVLSNHPMHSARQNLITFIETKMYNPLFKNMVYSFSHMEDHIEEGEFKNIAWVEGKWVKEGNALLSYYHGDLIMQRLYDAIAGCISPEDKSKIKIANRAGSFVIGFEEGVTLGTFKKLQELREARLEVDGTEMIIPIGISINSVEQFEADGKIQAARALGEQRKAAEKVWYSHMTEFIDKHPAYRKVLDALQIPGLSSGRSVDLQTRFIHEFFWHETRGVDRCMSTIRDIENKGLSYKHGNEMIDVIKYDIFSNLITYMRLREI